METNLTEVYLDNSATTRCSERAKDLMVKVLMEENGFKNIKVIQDLAGLDRVVIGNF